MAESNSDNTKSVAMAPSMGIDHTGIYVQKTPRKLYSADRQHYIIVYDRKESQNGDTADEEDSKAAPGLDVHDYTAFEYARNLKPPALQKAHRVVWNHRKQIKNLLATLSEQNCKFEGAMESDQESKGADTLGAFLGETRELEKKVDRWAGEIREAMWDIRDEMEVCWADVCWEGGLDD
ncbi:MAG: hypothetical protein Q9183_005882 [Haloplaca sp. 2 TL-2023]